MKLPSLEVLKRHVDVEATRFSSGIRWMVGVDDLKGLFQPEWLWFYEQKWNQYSIKLFHISLDHSGLVPGTASFISHLLTLWWQYTILSPRYLIFFSLPHAMHVIQLYEVSLMVAEKAATAEQGWGKHSQFHFASSKLLYLEQQRPSVILHCCKG